MEDDAVIAMYERLSTDVVYKIFVSPQPVTMKKFDGGLSVSVVVDADQSRRVAQKILDDRHPNVYTRERGLRRAMKTLTLCMLRQGASMRCTATYEEYLGKKAIQDELETRDDFQKFKNVTPMDIYGASTENLQAIADDPSYGPLCGTASHIIRSRNH